MSGVGFSAIGGNAKFQAAALVLKCEVAHYSPLLLAVLLIQPNGMFWVRR